VVLPPLALAPLVGLLGCPLVVLLVVLLRILLAPIADKWHKAAGAAIGGRVVLGSVVLHIRRPVDMEGLTGAFPCRLVAALEGGLVPLPDLQVRTEGSANAHKFAYWCSELAFGIEGFVGAKCKTLCLVGTNMMWLFRAGPAIVGDHTGK
jgi:hypothetical protein